MTAASPEDAARLLEAREHLATARAPRAGRPAADAEALRTAYLDLLKLCLCDLAGTTTISVGAMPDGTVMSRELRGDELRLRAAGMDWPLQGLTMVGLGRLDDLQRCVETVVADDVRGDVIEAGAWRGGASLLMRATLDTLDDDRTVWVADSFQGFAPADAPPDDGAIDLPAFDFLAVSEEEVRESFARLGFEEGVMYVPGYFEDTLAALAAERWAIVRLDADTYAPTRHALRCLYPGLSVGGYLVIDDYGAFEGCRRAVDEFRHEHAITEPLEKVDSTCVRWRREREPREVDRSEPREPNRSEPRAVAPLADPRSVTAPPRPPASRRHAPVPTARELELTHELEALRHRLAAAEAQIGVRAWIRRRLGREQAR
jgi:O-methyltransferase